MTEQPLSADHAAIPADPDPTLQHYAEPQVLVTADWLAGHLGDSRVKIVEVSEDSVQYHIGHIPGAQRISAQVDLVDVETRNIASPTQFASLMQRLGIAPHDTVVLYGDHLNCWATFAFWVFQTYQHRDVRVLDGGRDMWFGQGRDSSWDVPDAHPSSYPTPTPAFDYLASHADLVGATLVDTRSTAEFVGATSAPPAAPATEATLRAGHIPGAINVPWRNLTSPEGGFARKTTLDEQITFASESVITYGRIGERSCHTWFVLRYLVGIADVRNYFGSWAEWSNFVGARIETGISGTKDD